MKTLVPPSVGGIFKNRIVKIACVCILLALVGFIGIQLYIHRPAPPLTDDQSVQMSKQLTSGSESDLRTSIALPNDQKLAPGVIQQLASLGKITFNTSTFHDNHDGTATVTAQVISPQGTKQNWVVTFVDVNGQWKINSTDPAQ